MSWPALIPLLLGSGVAGALIQKLVDHLLAERLRRRSQRSELAVGAARSVSDVLESIVLLVREHTSRTGSPDLDSDAWLRLKGDLCNKLVRHVQVIPDSLVREQLRMVDICIGSAEMIAERLPDAHTRSGYLRHDANVCVTAAVEGLSIIGTYLRGGRVKPSERLQLLWAALVASATRLVGPAPESAPKWTRCPVLEPSCAVTRCGYPERVRRGVFPRGAVVSTASADVAAAR
jgi:hypothetical protein